MSRIMNRERLQLAATLLDEVTAKTWQIPKVLRFYRPADGLEGELVEAGLLELGEDTPRPAFNLRYWGRLDYMPEETGKNEPHPCGFSACAVGHMCVDPRFQVLGLKADPAWTPLYQPTVEEAATLETEPLSTEDDEVISPLESFEAVALFFGITYEDALWLFQDNSYPHIVGTTITAADVAARIQQLLSRTE